MTEPAAGLLARIPGTDDAMQVVTSEVARQATEARAGSSRPDVFHGLLRITWPAEHDGRGLVGRKASLSATLYNDDGTVRHDGQIFTAEKITIHASANDFIWAELVMLADPDGNPLTGTERIPGHPSRHVLYPREDGNGFLTGTFAFLITSMKTAQP